MGKPYGASRKIPLTEKTDEREEQLWAAKLPSRILLNRERRFT